MSNTDVTTTTGSGTLPASGDVLRAGMNGAAIAGAWTGIYEVMRVRNGETSSDEAVRATATSAAIGAGAGAVANVVAHVARNVPMLGLAAIAAGALIYATQPKKAASVAKEEPAA